MTQDEIIQMAKEVGGTAYVNRHYPGETSFAFGPEAFKAFAKMVAAKEREACAKVCEAERILGIDDERAYYGELMAAAIRARSEA